MSNAFVYDQTPVSIVIAILASDSCIYLKAMLSIGLASQMVVRDVSIQPYFYTLQLALLFYSKQGSGGSGFTCYEFREPSTLITAAFVSLFLKRPETV